MAQARSSQVLDFALSLGYGFGGFGVYLGVLHCLVVPSLIQLPGPGEARATQRVWRVYSQSPAGPPLLRITHTMASGREEEVDTRGQGPFLSPSKTSQQREAARNLQVKRQGTSGGVRYMWGGGGYQSQPRGEGPAARSVDPRGWGASPAGLGS